MLVFRIPTHLSMLAMWIRIKRMRNIRYDTTKTAVNMVETERRFFYEEKGN